MALTAKVDLTVTPNTLTVTSDKRVVYKGTAAVGGETVSYSAYLEPTITDSTGKVWVKKSDDGVVAVYS